MFTFDVVDETVIAATPAQVAQSLGDEATRRTGVAAASGDPTGRRRPGRRAGAWFDVTVNSSGNPRSRFALSFRQRTVQAEDDRNVAEYVSGPLRGRFETTVEAVDATHNRVRTHSRADPHGFTHLLFLLVNVPAGHSRVMERGFHQLGQHNTSSTAAT